MNKSVVLIGFMGCGKSTIGTRLSWKLRIPMEDTDKSIERMEGISISEIFATKGEEAFRDMETALLEKIAGRKSLNIISVGGGTPVRPINRKLLKRCGMVFYFRLKPETVYERIKGDTTRPLLQCEDPMEKIRSLMESRKQAYEEAADIVIDVDDLSVDQVVGKVMEYLKK